MIAFENTEVFNFEGALRGMRNPMNSWSRSDNGGEADMALAAKLIRGGTEHRKFLRQIFVSVDITAPFYWWKEFDTYKVGTVANSCSTMHKLTSAPITAADFSFDGPRPEFDAVIGACEQLRLSYLETKDKDTWRALIQLLPCAYNQRRTVTLNYENLLSIHRQRENHKLSEWHRFCDWIDTLPKMDVFLAAARGE